MNVLRRSHTVALALSALALAVSAACSPAQPTPAATAKPAAPTAAPTAAAAAQPTPAPAQPTSAAAAKPTEAAAGTSQWYEGARREGALVIYGIGGEALVPLKKGFEARYPGINVEGVDQSGQQTREKIIAEAGARQIRADIASAGGTSTAELAKLGLLEEYRSPEVARLIPEIVDPRGYMSPRVVNMYGITINTNLVPPAEEPKSWRDLLNPKWKGGKIAMGDPRGSGSGGTILYGLEKTLGPEFVAQLATQDLFFGRENAALLNGVVRGEQAILLTASSRTVVEQRLKGAPVKVIKPEEGVGITPISVGVVKDAPHPNAAKLFLDWILSEEGQIASAEAGDPPARLGVKAAYPESDMNGVKILPRDDQEAGTPAEVERMKAWDKLFFGN